MRDPAIIEAELQHFELQLQRVERGELAAELFKRIRLQYGVYGLRHAPTRHMVRVRVPLGIITPHQLNGLADACDVLTSSRVCHLTTRQDVQLYGVDRALVPTLLRRLARVHLTSREASGNVVRNITLCPWAGISPEEAFDITPYAQAVSDYFLRNSLTQLLPRKVKIAFEGCPTDHARTPIHDIGVVAAVQEGRVGFRIYVGGGLGPAPRAARLLEPWTDESLLLPTIEAMLRVFDRHGERRNRARARLKFLIEQMGWEAFQARALQERELVWATQSGCALTALKACPTPQPRLRPASLRPDAGTANAACARWHATNVAPQRQSGFVCVTVRVPCGDLTPTQLRGIAALALEYANGVRLTNAQNLLLRGVREEACATLYEALQGLDLAEGGSGRLADVTRCPGADSCLSAITHPRGLAQALEQLFHNGLSRLADAPLSIKISGCPNSCGHHAIADVGFFGMAVKVGQRHIPCYQVLVGGGTQEGAARFGQRVARVPARRAPEAAKRLIQFYDQRRNPDESFAAFADRVGFAPLQELLQDLTDISDSPDLSVDLGTTEPFALEAGKGECAE